MKNNLLALVLFALLGQTTSLAQTVNLAGKGQENFVERFHALKREYRSQRSDKEKNAIYKELKKLEPKFKKQVTLEEMKQIGIELTGIRVQHQTGKEFDQFIADFAKALGNAWEEQLDKNDAIQLAQSQQKDVKPSQSNPSSATASPPQTSNDSEVLPPESSAGNWLITANGILILLAIPFLWFLLILYFRRKSRKMPKQPLQPTLSKTFLTLKPAETPQPDLLEFMKKSQATAFWQPGSEGQRIQDLEEENQRLVKDVETKYERIARLENELENALAKAAATKSKAESDKRKFQKEINDLQARFDGQASELEKAKLVNINTAFGSDVAEIIASATTKPSKNNAVTVSQKKVTGKLFLEFFQAHPNRDGSFSPSNKTNRFKPFASMYRFLIVNEAENLAEFEFVSDPSNLPDALNYPDVYLMPACVNLNPPNPLARSVLTVEKGVAKLIGDQWKVQKPASIQFVT